MLTNEIGPTWHLVIHSQAYEVFISNSCCLKQHIVYSKSGDSTLFTVKRKPCFQLVIFLILVRFFSLRCYYLFTFCIYILAFVFYPK